MLPLSLGGRGMGEGDHTNLKASVSESGTVPTQIHAARFRETLSFPRSLSRILRFATFARPVQQKRESMRRVDFDGRTMDPRFRGDDTNFSLKVVPLTPLPFP